MSRIPGVKDALTLLGSLKDAIAGFTAREARLKREYSDRHYNAKKAFDEGIEDCENRLANGINAATKLIKEKKERNEARYEERKFQILKAYNASKQHLLQRVEGRKGTTIGGLQPKILQSKKDRAAAQAQVDAELDHFKGALGVDGSNYMAIRARAKKAFIGYRAFSSRLKRAAKGDKSEVDSDMEEHDLLEEFRKIVEQADDEARNFQTHTIPKIFRVIPLALIIMLSLIGGFGIVHAMGYSSTAYAVGGGTALGIILLTTLVHHLGGKAAGADARKLIATLARGRTLYDACLRRSEARHMEAHKKIEREYAEKKERLEIQWEAATENASESQESGQERIEKQKIRAEETNERIYRKNIKRLEPEPEATIERLRHEATDLENELNETFEKATAQIEEDNRAGWEQLVADWNAESGPMFESLQSMIAVTGERFPEWTTEYRENWSPPEESAHAAKFAELAVDVETLAGGLPDDERLAMHGPKELVVPLSLAFPDQGSILFETEDSGQETAIHALNNIILRLLSSSPPGKLAFTIIDPVGLGENFAGVMHLSDYEETLINSKIWTQTQQIEQRLADLNEQIEKIIQMYLRNEYETITEYNLAAGNIAEKYQFLVIADFPVNFSDMAAKRLMSIATSGARCGIYTLIHWDKRHTLPQDFVPDDLRASGTTIKCKGEKFTLVGGFPEATQLVFDDPPDAEFAIDFIHKIGKTSIDSNRVEVPFSHVAPPDDEMWTEETTKELQVPIGRTGATKLQYLAIGKGTKQHALVAGKTGSGKSTLFHVIITNLSLHCSPEQVEFYLIDFKKGVEFKCYASRKLPHAKVVAIESDREFGLSVLQRVDDELKRRGDLFRKLGVQDVAGYKNAGGTEPIPRSLLMIDEFQEFFVEDDRISQNASVLLDRIVRQGRAFGIHVILGSQTLGGAYTIARTTLGQMVIRIALQCNEADAYLIMDDTNPAPRLLTRPGEGIYNDSAGALEGNSPFQAVWLPEDVRDSYLDKVVDLAAKSGGGYSVPIVFEGNAPADIRENMLLAKRLEAPSMKLGSAFHAWLGAPNSIKGPTEAIFQRQGGNNLLIVGQRDEAALAITAVSIISLAAQHAQDGAKFYLFDSAAPGSQEQEYLERVMEAIPHEITPVKNHNLAEVMDAVAAEVSQRSSDEHAAEAPSIYLFMVGLQKYKKLRYEEDFGFSMDDEEKTADPGTQFNNILTEGASVGVHTIATIDTYNNVNRMINRKALSEFELRILFQMSANDSAALIDTPKAGNLGLHRALFYNEHEGYLETFRPYALPGIEWIDEAAEKLEALHAQPSR